MEVSTNSARVGAGASDACLKEGLTSIGSRQSNTSSDETVAYPVLVLTTAIALITCLIRNTTIHSLKNPKVPSHARRKLGPKSNEVEWGKTNPEVAATEVGDVRLTSIGRIERWESFGPFHRCQSDRSKVVDRQQHN